jgi:apolipoprotein N-acyltransferase
MIPFSVFTAGWTRRFGSARLLPNLGQLVGGAVVWAGSEFLRSRLFTGFGWNALAVSQYRNLPVLQLAEFGGVPLISLLMVLVNGGVVLTVLRYVREGARGIRRPHYEIMTVLLVLACGFSFGMMRLMNPHRRAAESVQVALVQPSIPQVEKWTAQHDQKIYERLKTLSQYAAQVSGLDLIIWPETALPDFALNSVRSLEVIRETVSDGVPLLAGSMEVSWAAEEARYFNSALLFDTSGACVEKYDKQHLVLFGEYVPLAERLPFLKALTPIQSSFTAGTDAVQFRLPNKAHLPFSVLICFEDTLAPLARSAVRDGARWLVNLTNDAWFDPSAESRQHLAHSVFRAVENRVPLVRSANTGISAVIDADGRIVQTVEGPDGSWRGVGFLTASVQVLPEGRLTVFTRYGGGWTGLLSWAGFAFLTTALCGKKKH